MASFAQKFGIVATIVTQIDTIQVDCSLFQLHDFDSHITDNPVEDGTLFADHVVLLPTVIEIEGRISNASASIINTIRGKMTAKEAHREFVRLQRDRQPFTVVTGLQTYQNMLLQRYSVPRAPLDGESIRFVATLREVMIIGSDRPTNRDLVGVDVQHTALPIVNGGFITKAAVV